jgi:thermitase
VNIKRFFPLLVALVIVTLAVLPVSAQAPVPTTTPPPADFDVPLTGYVPGEILVKFKPNLNRLGAQATLADNGLQVAGAVQPIGVLKVAVEPGQELAAIDALERDPNVLYAEPNYIAIALDTIPNDSGYASQWGLPKIGAPSAWDITTASSNVVIAVVDTGIDLDHPDFSCPGKLLGGRNFVSPGSSPNDDHGHGTHVAGIAAACTNNVTGVAGVAWGARLMPVKVLDYRGSGTYEQVANGITYAADQGADVINLSLGGTGPNNTLSDAVEYARNRGSLVVAAAGNCGSGCWMGGQYYYNPLFYPAAYPATLAVAATGSNDNWASFSEHHPYVDVAAPGVSIYSTLIDGYGTMDGTSMATPFVSGLAALIWSLNPGLSPDQVRDIIQDTADDLQTPPGEGGPGKDDYTGYGRINAGRALGTMVGLQTSPTQVSFLIDDDSGPFPSSVRVQVTTTSLEPIIWSTTISPAVNWLEIVPPASGSVSAAALGTFTLRVPTRPSGYGTYATTVIVTGTTASGSVVSRATTVVEIRYVSNLHQSRFPIIVRNHSY